ARIRRAFSSASSGQSDEVRAGALSLAVQVGRCVQHGKVEVRGQDQVRFVAFRDAEDAAAHAANASLTGERTGDESTEDGTCWIGGVDQRQALLEEAIERGAGGEALFELIEDQVLNSHAPGTLVADVFSTRDESDVRLVEWDADPRKQRS